MTATPTGRQGMVDKGNVLNTYRAQLGYTEGPLRMMGEKLTWPEVVAALKAGKTLTGDCSAFYTEDAEWNGCTDPNGLHFNGYGFTGTLLNNMPHITVAEILPGDAIVFGAYPGLHVVWATDSHPTNPPVHSPPFNPTIDSHGTPGFTESTLQQMWQAGFPGQPITVLSLAPFLPKPPTPPPSYHYERYDEIKVNLPHGRNSEANVVKNYDVARKNPKANAAQLKVIELNLAQLVTNLENVMAAHDPKGLRFNRAWRLPRLRTRATGGVVKPD